MSETLIRIGDKYHVQVSKEGEAVHVIGHDFGPHLVLVVDGRPVGLIVKMSGFRAWIARDQQEYVSTEYWALDRIAGNHYEVTDAIAPGRQKMILFGWLMRNKLRLAAAMRDDET